MTADATWTTDVASPHVHPAGDVVVLELAPPQAEVLAHVLAQYDARAAVHPIAGYDTDTWIHTAVRLLGAAAMLGHHDEQVDVPLLRHPVYFTPDQWGHALDHPTGGDDS